MATVVGVAVWRSTREWVGGAEGCGGGGVVRARLLAAMAKETLGPDPLAGTVLVFRNRHDCPTYRGHAREPMIGA